jgi:prefoldin subunit 5
MAYLYNDKESGKLCLIDYSSLFLSNNTEVDFYKCYDFDNNKYAEIFDYIPTSKKNIETLNSIKDKPAIYHFLSKRFFRIKNIADNKYRLELSISKTDYQDELKNPFSNEYRFIGNIFLINNTIYCVLTTEPDYILRQKAPQNYNPHEFKPKILCEIKDGRPKKIIEGLFPGGLTVPQKGVYVLERKIKTPSEHVEIPKKYMPQIISNSEYYNSQLVSLNIQTGKIRKVFEKEINPDIISILNEQQLLIQNGRSLFIFDCVSGKKKHIIDIPENITINNTINSHSSYFEEVKSLKNRSSYYSYDLQLSSKSKEIILLYGKTTNSSDGKKNVLLIIKFNKEKNNFTLSIKDFQGNIFLEDAPFIYPFE